MKKLKRHKLFSGALQFTIFIGVVVALLLAGLVMLENTHNFFIEQSKATIENIQLANSGVNYLINDGQQSNDTITIESVSNENQTLQGNLSKWGIFEKAVVKATNRKKIFYKSALLGTNMISSKRPTLYLQDNYKPLVVVGNTILRGTVLIPSQGINPGYIAGESFYGKELVQGIIKKSNTLLPKLKKDYKEELELLLKNNNFNQNNFISESDISKITNSFLKPTKIYYSKNSIELNNVAIVGNVIIKSDEFIRIKKSAILKDIIIIAPEIEIQDEVTGNFQVFASKKISVGKGCKLSYPSALVLIQEKESEVKAVIKPQEYKITIDKNTQIIGSICYFKSIKENDFKTQLTLEQNSVVKGEVYCQGNFELKGKVVGSVFTEQFIVNAAGSIFINHVYNGEILQDNFPESFCGILFEDNTKAVAKWMY